MNGVPMKKDELGADEFEEAIVSSILKQTPELQKAVYHVCSSVLSDILLKCRPLMNFLAVPLDYILYGNYVSGFYL